MLLKSVLSFKDFSTIRAVVFCCIVAFFEQRFSVNTFPVRGGGQCHNFADGKRKNIRAFVSDYLLSKVRCLIWTDCS